MNNSNTYITDNYATESVARDDDMQTACVRKLRELADQIEAGTEEVQFYNIIAPIQGGHPSRARLDYTGHVIYQFLLYRPIPGR